MINQEQVIKSLISGFNKSNNLNIGFVQYAVASPGFITPEDKIVPVFNLMTRLIYAVKMSVD